MSKYEYDTDYTLLEFDRGELYFWNGGSLSKEETKKLYEVMHEYYTDNKHRYIKKENDE